MDTGKILWCLSLIRKLEKGRGPFYLENIYSKMANRRDVSCTKSELKLESLRVRSLRKLNFTFFLVSAIISYMSLQVEKQNIFFYTVIERARSIKRNNQIKMFLYRFLSRIKSILKKIYKVLNTLNILKNALINN